MQVKTTPWLCLVSNIIIISMWGTLKEKKKVKL